MDSLADLGCGAASSSSADIGSSWTGLGGPNKTHGTAIESSPFGPEPTLNTRSGCCGRSLYCGPSLPSRNLGAVKLSVCGTKLPFDFGALLTQHPNAPAARHLLRRGACLIAVVRGGRFCLNRHRNFTAARLGWNGVGRSGLAQLQLVLTQHSFAIATVDARRCGRCRQTGHS